MHRGYVRYWRKIKEWSWFKVPITKCLFLHLVAEANHSNYNFMGFTISRGQVVVGRKTLSFDLGISEDQVRTAINHLKTTNDITVKTTNKFSIVSIANYELYQGKIPDRIPNRIPDQSPTNPQQIPTIKECKNEKNEKRTRAFSAPSLEDVKAYVAEISSSVDPYQFFSKQEAIGWMVGKHPMKDWKATIRYWGRFEQKKSETKKTGMPKLIGAEMYGKI